MDYKLNFTTNSSGYNYSWSDFILNYDSSQYVLSRDISRYFSMVGIPILILVGTTGSLLSLLVFSSTKLRNQSCTVYLAYLNIVDFGFLCSLIPPWLSWFGIDIFYRNGWCQATVFSSSVFSFLSVWIVVAFTVERYIVVYHPFKKSVMCTRKRALIVVFSLTTVTFVLFSYLPFTTGIQQYIGSNVSVCVPYPQHYKAVYYLTTIDTVLTMIIPFVVILVLNTAIIIKLFKLAESLPRNIFKLANRNSKRQRLVCNNNQGSSKERNDEQDIEIATPMINNRNCRNQKDSPKPGSIQASCLRRRNQNQIKTTRSLVIISSIFILLNSPSHAFKLYFIFSDIIGSFPAHSSVIHITQECTQFLYYMNFATNMLQYVAFSQGFREGLIALVKRCRNRHVHWKDHMRRSDLA